MFRAPQPGQDANDARKREIIERTRAYPWGGGNQSQWPSRIPTSIDGGTGAPKPQFPSGTMGIPRGEFSQMPTSGMGAPKPQFPMAGGTQNIDRAKAMSLINSLRGNVLQGQGGFTGGPVSKTPGTMYAGGSAAFDEFSGQNTMPTPRSPGTMYAGGAPNFNEQARQYRTSQPAPNADRRMMKRASMADRLRQSRPFIPYRTS